MLCKEIKDEIFEAALSGAAPGDKAKAHLSGCAACESEYQSMLSTMNVLDTWTTPEPSPYFDVRLRARLRDVREQEQHGVLSHWLEKVGIRQLTWKPIAAAGFALVMAVGVYVEMPGSIPHAVPKGPVVEAACPVVDLQALDNNSQVLNALQDLDDDSTNNAPEAVSE